MTGWTSTKSSFPNERVPTFWGGTVDCGLSRTFLGPSPSTRRLW